MTEGTEVSAGTPGAGRGVKVALILSLALNLAIGGLVVGAALGGHRVRPGMMMGPDVGFGPLTGGLTREDRRALRQRFEMAAPDFHGERSANAADFRALAGLLRADPFDPAAAEAILARQGERMRERLGQGRKVFLDYIASLTPAARVALADRIERQLKGRRP